MTVNTALVDHRLNENPACSQRTFSTSTADARSDSQHQPKLQHRSDDAPVYVLTLRTDDTHHDHMNQLRKVYFPPKLNKLEAHITLFHALPQEKLEGEIVPAIEAVAKRTSPYRIKASEAFKLRLGVAITVQDDVDYATKGRDGKGRNMTRIIHAELRKKWSHWLSEQDSSRPRIHYTVANKINQEPEVERIFQEVGKILERSGGQTRGASSRDVPDEGPSETSASSPNNYNKEPVKLMGEVQGLTLWRYKPSGHWVEPRNFEFGGR